MIATGLLLSVAGIAFTYARPVDKLAPVQPLGSIFHPALALSTLGQLIIHLCAMVYAIRITRAAATGDEVVAQPYQPEFVTAFLAASASPASKKFKPALLNTVVFLVETAQQVAVMAVNYKGRPFMLASTENAPMLWSLLACGAGLFAAASEHYPLLNGTLRLVELPSDEFRSQIMAVLAITVFGAFLWDRVIMMLFAPKLVWQGYADAFEALPTFAQLTHKISLGVYWFVVLTAWAVSDSILVLLAGIYFWTKNPAMRKWRGLDE